MFTVPLWIFLKMTEIHPHEELLAPAPVLTAIKKAAPIRWYSCGTHVLPLKFGEILNLAIRVRHGETTKIWAKLRISSVICIHLLHPFV